MAAEAGEVLSAREYEQLRRACRTDREELVVRLAGEAGLRAGELVRVRPADLTPSDGSSLEYKLVVREGDGNRRTVPLLSDLADTVQQYLEASDIDDDEEIVDVSERRVQMLVSAVADRAEEAVGDVTPASLRQYFARRLLVEDGVDVRAVTAAGGWEGVDSLLSSVPAPADSEVTAAFEQLEATRDTAGRLPAVVETLDSVVDSLAETNSRSELERAVCQQLVDQYDAAWILDRDPNRDRAHAGEDPDYFQGDRDVSVLDQRLQSGRVQVTPDERSSGLLAAVPVRHGETEHGVLVVRAAAEAFEEPERRALAMLGRQVSLALTAVDRKQLVLGGVVLEVQFQYDDTAAVFVDLAAALDTRLSLDGAVPSDDGLLCFVTFKGSAQAALEAATACDPIAGARLISSTEDEGVLELSLTGSSPLLVVTDRGGTVTELTVEDGQATLTCELAPDADLRAIHDRLAATVGAELRSKQERTATTAGLDSSSLLEEQLTEKQRDVIRTAYHSGYFEWPRGSTAEDLAESMGVSSPTLHNHLRRAQQSILAELLEE
ncbi:bacterio-opsin activator domain-containing protein [Halovenus halobia]|uniref:bacterio-opsin activator domain-containing protein n=1 Tax=Halovenus halobia TaxID=3396622 RepID=UPI003F57B7F9